MDFLQSRVMDIETALFGVDKPPKPTQTTLYPQCADCAETHVFCGREDCPDFVQLLDGRVYSRFYVDWAEKTSILRRLERIEEAIKKLQEEKK